MTQPSILDQWRRFVEGLSPSNQISDVILASWRRSREAGVPTAREALVFRRVDEEDLERRRFAVRELLTTAKRHLDWLDTQLSDVLHLVSIADRDGIVIVSRGPHRLLDTFGLLPGFDWSETAMGTNGAGTALAINAPVAVIGPEHFSTAWHECACAAAPVHAPDGSIIGVVDLSTSVSNANPNHLALVSYVASMIDIELQLHATLDERARSEEREHASRHHAVTEMLRGSEERFAIADDAPTVLWVTDANGAIQFVNRAYCEFFGTTLEAITHSGWQPLIHADDAPHYIDTFSKALQERQPFRAQARVRCADGQWRWIECYGQPRYSASGEFLGMAGSSLDITDRKNAEEALREADRRKDEFLAVLSHELRNPLAPIRSSLDVLERATPGSEQAQRAQAVIGRQMTHLTRLVDDLLDVTRIGRGKIQLQRERLELTELVRRTAEDHRIAFMANGVSLSVAVADMPLWINADATRIAQVIGNLLQNAAKFTPPNGEVEVSLEARDDSSAVLSVRDTGVGIPRDMLRTIFEPFAQADTTLARTRGGLGIGLALVRGLTELHGGSVGATSDGDGRGSTFVVRLPLESAPAVRVVPGTMTTQSFRRRVLVVEDNVDAANGLQELLALDGHEVAVAYSGHDGLRKARDLRPDVVLCDIGLPEMDGYAVARAFRQDNVLSEALLVALTGYALPGDLRKAAEAGFDLHLAKPPNIESLQNVLRQATPRTKGDTAPDTVLNAVDALERLRTG